MRDGNPSRDHLPRRVRVDGKQFQLDDQRFRFRGVTYGTFRPRADGARFPATRQVEHDFRAISGAGFTVVRTYTTPPDDVVQLAADHDLRLLIDVFYPDWRYLLGHNRHSLRAVEKKAKAAVRAAASRLQGRPTVLALSLGNEIPADVLRWFGTKPITGLITELAEVVREEDPGMLVTYANYPTAEYLSLPTLDFVTFNIFLEQQPAFRRYLTRLHHLAGDRPLVLGEIGCHAGKDPSVEERQAEMLDWMLETAIERGVAGTCVFSWTDEWWVGDAPVEGWHFGLTDAGRRPRRALKVAADWNRRDVADLSFDWPSISVVICAYNAAATLDECLRHTRALDYPRLEIIVVDDGSTDDTAAIVRRHPGVRLVQIGHAGLSVARNEGIRAARGEVVAYLDSDAYPPPEWPYYLALGFDGPTVGGVGGPNVPPADAPRGAQVVARSPGGPVHVLLSDDRAEHVPGCNMAFWKRLLEDIGGFDPVYTAAGDDVDLCWRMLDRAWDIGFHPAALVWHHRRQGLRAYLRQQSGYGRAEALVRVRHPTRFNAMGTARWRGRIYNPLRAEAGRQRIYRGPYGTAAYQSVYEAGGHLLDLAHQAGVPLAAPLVPTAFLGLFHPLLALPALIGTLTLVALAGIDGLRTQPSRGDTRRPWRFRGAVALHHLLQPLARAWAHLRHSRRAQRGLSPPEFLPRGGHRIDRGTWLLPHDRPRERSAAAIVEQLRRRGLRIDLPDTGWEDHDAQWRASSLVVGQLITSAHPVGSVQVRFRVRVVPKAALIAVAALAILLWLEPTAAGLLALVIVGELGRGWWRSHTALHAVLSQRHQTGGEPTRRGPRVRASEEPVAPPAGLASRIDGRRSPSLSPGQPSATSTAKDGR
ncbi:MAG TPA: glycosyltransferase [Nitriliruptorales bacterium]|nr:glycosyltransferase [Nitriliruptorales bacterium]